MRVYGLERYCIGAAADPAQGGTVLLGYAGLSEEEIAAVSYTHLRSLDTEEMFEKLNICQAANQKIQDEYQTADS